MSILLPNARIRTMALRPVLFSGDQEGSLGGESLPVPRVGDRWGLDVTTTQLRMDGPGRELIAALTVATTEDARIAIDQPNIEVPINAGATVVEGDGGGGTSLNIRNGNPGAVVQTGVYFSIVHGGRRYFHMAAAAALIGGNGKAQLSIWPMLRFLTVDGEAVEIDDPTIEGKLTGFEKGATWVRNRVDPITFSIAERA